MKQVTKEDLQMALQAWELAREKALVHHDNLGGFLKRKHDQIKLDQEGLARSQLSTGYSHQVAKHKQDYPATFDQPPLRAAMKGMDDRGQVYRNLKEKFIDQQQR